MATPVEALQFIAKFKYLQAEFYRRGVSVFTSGVGTNFSPGELAVAQQILKQKNGQITQLKAALGSAAPVQPTPGTFYDMTAGSGSGTGPFANATGGVTPNRRQFFRLAQLFEDFGVRLLKGQLPDLMANRAHFTLAARIHAVEGRHAGEIRIMRGGGGTASKSMVTKSTTAFTTLIFPWITFSATAMYDTGTEGFTGSEADTNSEAFVTTLVYGVFYTGADRFNIPQTTEANQNQRGYSPATAEAFDEPLPTVEAAKFLARFGVV